MRYEKRDRAKIVVLAVVLGGLWVFIGVRFAVLSRQHKAKLRAQEQAHAAAHGQMPASQGAPGASTTSQALRLAALVAPVSPPKSDPFHPIIAPRSSGAASAPAVTSSRPPEPDQGAALPPLPGEGSSRGRDRLTLTGIVAGNPSTAVLRLGDDHYVVREGDLLDSNLRVLKIARTTVTLRDGRTTYTLRLGS